MERELDGYVEWVCKAGNLSRSTFFKILQFVNDICSFFKISIENDVLKRFLRDSSSEFELFFEEKKIPFS